MEKKVEVKLKNAFNLIIVFCLMIAALLVLGTSIATTIYYDYGCDNDWPHYKRENLPLLLLLCAVVFLLLFLIKKKNRSGIFAVIPYKKEKPFY